MSSCRSGTGGRAGRGTRAPAGLLPLLPLRPFACLVAVTLMAGTACADPALRYPGIGRPATPAELAAWDIDVRPDFRGLPPGRGSVAEGQALWDARCASCHGVFGESNEFFPPLVGGTDAEDRRRGRVARLADPAYPVRTSLMKLATVSTLWDVIARAMPWNEPRSLAANEVYAVTAYLLHLGDVVDADFVLDERSIVDVQQRLPNRNGLVTDHGLWPGRALGNGGRPDTRARACMRDCGAPAQPVGFPPGHDRASHGNPAAQNRLVGAQRGVETSSNRQR